MRLREETHKSRKSKNHESWSPTRVGDVIILRRRTDPGRAVASVAPLTDMKDITEMLRCVPAHPGRVGAGVTNT